MLEISQKNGYLINSCYGCHIMTEEIKTQIEITSAEYGTKLPTHIFFLLTLGINLSGLWRKLPKSALPNMEPKYKIIYIKNFTLNETKKIISRLLDYILTTMLEISQKITNTL